MQQLYQDNKTKYKLLREKNFMFNNPLTTDYINILMVSHNARMRCLLEDIASAEMQEYREEYKIKEIRFKNCCILKLAIRKDSMYATLSMVYGGLVNNRKHGMYFRSTYDIDNHQNDVVFFPIIFNIDKLGISTNDIKNNCNIYIIRHGEATHNLKRSLHLKKDTLLTTASGIPHTQIASEILKTMLLKEKNTNISYCFCSDLKRTRQTLAIFMKTLNVYTKMIVLPCSNEIKYSEHGKCDTKNTGFFNIIPFENKESCSANRQASMCSTIDNYDIDWSIYDKFKLDNKSCSNYNMIQLLLNIITYY